jgi:TonB family protein
MKRRARCIACLAAALAALAARAAAAEWQKALAGPLSPGSVALLVEHRTEPGVRERWAAALKDDRPEVRAAAARVIDVSGSTWLVPDLITALSHEADTAAAIEEIRAIGSLGGASMDAALVAAATRLKTPIVDVVAETLGRTRGADAFVHLSALRSAGLSPTGYAYLARMAVRRGPGDTTRAAMAAVRESDVMAWAAVLDEARRARNAFEVGLIRVALGMEAPRFRALTYWHLAREADRGVPIAPDVAAALEATPEATNKEPGDLDAQFAFEILQRTQARYPRPVSGWTAGAREHRSMLAFPMNYDDPMLKRLTGEEREAAQPPEPKEWKPPAAKPSGPSEMPMRLTTRFPGRFASDLVRASGCTPRSQDLAGALINYAPDGRPGHVSLAESGLSGGCLEAGRALLLSLLAPPGDITPSIFVAVPLAPDVLSCGDEEPGPRARSSVPGPAVVGGRIKEPKKLVNVPPLYPEAARREHVQGVVILEATISTSGCIGELRVLQGVRMLNAAALSAVMRWRYTPTLLDGEPVPVIMTVTVNFRLS